jgi:DNA primase
MADPYAVAAVLNEIGIEDIYIDGDEVHARCYDHERRTGQREHRPRHWSINATTGLHHCFSCEWSGSSLVRLVMEVKGVGLWEATRLVNDHRVEFDPAAQNGDGDYYGDDERHEHISGPEELRQIFDQRYDAEIPERALKKRHLTQQACTDYEVRFDGVSGWALPIFDQQSTLDGWQVKPGGTLKPWIEPEPWRQLPDGTMDGVHTSEHLFGFDRLDATTVIMVESPLDVVYLHSLGHPFSAVASFGSHVSDAQMRLLVNSYTVSLVLALDNDESGWTGMRSIIDRGWHKTIPLHVFDYGYATGKDPGELTAEQIEYGLAHAQWVPKRRRRETK